MKQTNTRSVVGLIYVLSLVYLSLPFLLFVFFWIRLPNSLLLGAVILYCLYVSTKHFGPIRLPARRNVLTKPVLISIGIISAWVLFSGIGGLA